MFPRSFRWLAEFIFIMLWDWGHYFLVVVIHWLLSTCRSYPNSLSYSSSPTTSIFKLANSQSDAPHVLILSDFLYPSVRENSPSRSVTWLAQANWNNLFILISVNLRPQWHLQNPFTMATRLIFEWSMMEQKSCRNIIESDIYLCQWIKRILTIMNHLQNFSVLDYRGSSKLSFRKILSSIVTILSLEVLYLFNM